MDLARKLYSYYSKIVPKAKKSQRMLTERHKKRSLAYYLLLYVILLFVGIFSFVVTRILVQAGDRALCANSKTCTSDLKLEIDNNIPGVFHGKTVMPPTIMPQEEKPTPVLGITTPVGPKHIYVDLENQVLYAYQGSTLILKTFVSTGKWGKTPVGNFNIWEKLRSTRMAGGEGDDAYDLPNVPYVMYFFHDFGLHGAYWHDNFGHTMSHGCVNMRQIDAKALFEWTDGPSGNTPGTPVSICNNINNGECIQNNPIQ